MSEHINDGGPAFPDVRSTDYLSSSCSRIETVGGMSLRDYFAAKAMHAIMQRYEADTRKTPSDAYRALAESAYNIADAMLAERSKGAK